MNRIVRRPPAGTVQATAPLQSDLGRLAYLLPVFLIVFGVAFQLFTPAHLNGSPFFMSAPLMAAPLFTRGKTIAVGAVALAAAAALQVVEEVAWGRFDRQSTTRQLTTIAFAAVLAVLLNAIVRRGRQQLASAREVAEAAQRAVLPRPPGHVAGLQVAARYEAARHDALIGGDLYGARATPHGVRLIIGDVRGKGITAIETVAVVLGAFREASEHEKTLPDVAQRLEEALARDQADRGGADAVEDFVTCVLVEIPAHRGVVRVVNCGHPEPLLLDGQGGITTLTPHEFRLPLGLSRLAPAPHRTDTWDFPRGGTLLLYTDGLSEARDASGTFYDPTARLADRTFPSPTRLLGTLADDVQEFSGGPTDDDMALLAAHRPHACAGPGALTGPHPTATRPPA
ncbi:PP2C family protein-serine/threonine phosphatase [Streptomyces phytophilus]|uniref:PP2C family protein-serine/threonine phosphatase n=1 Tax=Streptomyces phytophilus TaxID=722715 RepID=UPI0015F11B18|nr:PP2C family protein-serine/threonine phosphatase [Streptomyces phytophilus]